jgi:hypothetical protein
MTDTRCVSLVLLALTLVSFGGCHRPHAAVDQPRTVSPQTPPPPARNMVMICRSSRTGRKATCGTPDAVMVGMKPE